MSVCMSVCMYVMDRHDNLLLGRGRIIMRKLNIDCIALHIFHYRSDDTETYTTDSRLQTPDTRQTRDRQRHTQRRDVNTDTESPDVTQTRLERDDIHNKYRHSRHETDTRRDMQRVIHRREYRVSRRETDTLQTHTLQTHLERDRQSHTET